MATIAAIKVWGVPVDESTAWTAASRFLQTSTIARQSLPDRTATSIQARGSLWVVALSPSGHILVSGSDRATPIIGFSTNNFAEGDENSPERAALNAANAAVAAAEADATKPRHKRWDRLLDGTDAGAGKKAQPRLTTSGTEVNIEPFVKSKYNQNQPWNDLTPVTGKDADYIWRGRSCAGCVSIADAAIFRELRWPVYPARTDTVTHNLRGSFFDIRFDGSAPFDWDKMYDTYSYSGDMRGRVGAEEDKRYAIGRYVLWLNQSAAMSYNVGESTSTKYTAAHGCERDWYTIGRSMSPTEEGVKDLVTRTLAGGIPVFVGIGGHAVVADGWQDDDSDSYVHLVYGYGGNASDKFYSVATGPVHYFWVEHYPRAKPQLDPIPRVVGDSVTLSWHFPDCYTNNLFMFYIRVKRRTSPLVSEWTPDFSDAATGNAFPANIWYATNNFGATSVALDAEDLTYGYYQFSTPLKVTETSILSFKIRGGAHKSGDACKDNVVIEICGEDGNWHELFVPECNFAFWPGTWKENAHSLAAYAGQTVQLRIYKRHATYNGHVAIGDFKVTDVIPIMGEDVVQIALATDRSATLSNLVSGADYSFSVLPITYGAPVDAEPSDAKITTVNTSAALGMPAFTSIQYAANGGEPADLVDGSLADGPIGSSALYVRCPESVTNLVATSSHLTLVSNEMVHVAHLNDGRWKVTFDPVISANHDRQRMILTLHATDSNGTTVHRDVVMRMTEDVITVNTGEEWIVGEPYNLKRTLVLAGGTVTVSNALALCKDSTVMVTTNSTMRGDGTLSITNSNATITFSNSAMLSNGLNIESSSGVETLTLAGTGTFVQEPGTTIKVYDLELGEHVLLELNLSADQSTTNAIVQFGYETPSIAGWKLKIDAPADMPKGTYPLVWARTYLSMPNTIYLPSLQRECSVVVSNNNTLCFVVGDPMTEQFTDTDYPVPYSWFSIYHPGIEDYPDMVETFAKMDAANNQNKYWECYVLGLNPTNALDKFTATIRMEGQTPIVEFAPTNEVLRASGAIRYILQGKPALTNDWMDCPSFEAPGDTNRFFRVKVEWPE